MIRLKTLSFFQFRTVVRNVLTGLRLLGFKSHIANYSLPTRFKIIPIFRFLWQNWFPTSEQRHHHFQEMKNLWNTIIINIIIIKQTLRTIRSHYYDAFALCECEYFFFSPRTEREKLRYWALFSSAKQKGKHWRNSSDTPYFSLSVVTGFLHFKVHIEASFSCCRIAQPSFRIKRDLCHRVPITVLF